MKTEGTNLLFLRISAFWSSSKWPLATLMSSRRQTRKPLCGRYRQVSLYITRDLFWPLPHGMYFNHMHTKTWVVKDVCWWTPGTKDIHHSSLRDMGLCDRIIFTIHLMIFIGPAPFRHEWVNLGALIVTICTLSQAMSCLTQYPT